jgi:FkbM family methyltransferase
MKSIIKKILEGMGYHVYKKNFMPFMVNHSLDIKRLSRNPKGICNIFDIGANKGEMALIYGAEFPWANIHAFEPVKKTFEQLRKKTSCNPKICVHNFALGGSSGSAKIFHGPSALMHSMNASAFPDSTFETVEVSTIDKQIEEGIPSPDFIKIDTEGFEMDVLAGSTGWLESTGPKFLLVETTFRKPEKAHPQLKHQTPFATIFDFVGDFGFEFVGIYDPDFNGFNPPRPPLSYCNALFFKSKN